jgi:hypothetical protein
VWASPLGWSRGGSGTRDKFRRWTPRNVTMNPEMREKVFEVSDVLNPWKRMREATIVHDENPT